MTPPRSLSPLRFAAASALLLLSARTAMPDVSSSTQPTTRPTISWLTVDFAGPQRERIPPLVFHTSDDDLPTLRKNLPDPLDPIRLQPAHFTVITQWLQAHPPAKQPPQDRKTGHLRLMLGTPTTLTSSTHLPIPDARAFFFALTHDLNLPPRARTAASNFASSHGLDK